MLHFKSCKKKFYIDDAGPDLEGQLVKCKHCNEQWIYESKSKYLENRLVDLAQDLEKTELKIDLKKKEYQDKIKNLEYDLSNKKEELIHQQQLQGKVTAFEQRLKDTEKLDAEQQELFGNLLRVKKDIRKTSVEIETTNNDIEEKTSYIETKINSFNNDENDKITKHDQIVKIVNSDVVDINTSFNKVVDTKKNQPNKNKKEKKFSFFTSGFTE